MKPLRLDDIWHLLPPVDELRPVLDLLLQRSATDPDRTWAASGELGTVGDRLVPDEALALDPQELAAREQARLGALFGHVGRALDRLAQGDRNGAARAFLDVAALEESADRPHRAEAWATAAHGVARGERDQSVAALALRRQGRASRALGRLDEALPRYRESYRICEAMGDGRAAAEAAVGAGNVLEDRGEWDEAETWYRRALEVLDTAGEKGAPERWHALLNLHIVFRSRGQVETSLGYLEEAEAAAGGAPESIPFLENARGQLAEAQGEPARAEGHYRTALAAAEASLPRVVIGVNLADALLAQGRHLDAAEAARTAEAAAVSGSVVTRLPEVYRVLGRIASAGGNPDAFVLFERALELVRDRGLPRLEEARTLQAYAEAEALHGAADTAWDLHRMANELYGEVGVRHLRHPWSPFFETEPDNGHEPPSPLDGESHG